MFSLCFHSSFFCCYLYNFALSIFYSEAFAKASSSRYCAVRGCKNNLFGVIVQNFLRALTKITYTFLQQQKRN